MKQLFKVSGTITYNFSGSVYVDFDEDDDVLELAATVARDALHDGHFADSYDIDGDDIDVETAT